MSVSPTGLPITGSRKFCLYWIQSQTTRRLARSADEAQTASRIGPTAARAAADSRSFLTGRRSTSIGYRPDAGLVEDAGHRPLVARHEQVHPGHALDRGSCWMVSAASRAPSAAVWSAGTARSLWYTSSGTVTPGTLSRMKSSPRRDLTAPTPARM